MSYRVAPHVALVMAKDRDGKLWYHWGPASGCVIFQGANVGPDIAWLNDEQRESLLRNGMVIEVDADKIKDGLSSGLDTDDIADLVGHLDRLGVPAGCGAPTARKALRDAYIPCSNDAIAAVVRIRKQRLLAEKLV